MPSTQMRCMITANRRGSATIAWCCQRHDHAKYLLLVTTKTLIERLMASIAPSKVLATLERGRLLTTGSRTPMKISSILTLDQQRLLCTSTSSIVGVVEMVMHQTGNCGVAHWFHRKFATVIHFHDLTHRYENGGGAGPNGRTNPISTSSSNTCDFIVSSAGSESVALALV